MPLRRLPGDLPSYPAHLAPPGEHPALLPRATTYCLDRPAVSQMRVRAKSAKLSEHSNNAERRRDHSTLPA